MQIHKIYMHILHNIIDLELKILKNTRNHELKIKAYLDIIMNFNMQKRNTFKNTCAFLYYHLSVCIYVFISECVCIRARVCIFVGTYQHENVIHQQKCEVYSNSNCSSHSH